MSRRVIAATLSILFAPPVVHAQQSIERYHYSMTVRVRPLLVFWITRSGVGEATVTRQEEPGSARYSLLIGSDPERAPRHINRWGYIEEQIHGADARLIGLMTQSDEDSIAAAEAGVAQQAAGHHPFRIIEATVAGDRASSRVMSVAAPEDYTFRQLPAVLGLVQHESAGKTRAIELPPGTRPGFLAALADMMRSASGKPITYVYHGRLYELRRSRTRSMADAIAAEFVITSLHDHEQTPFSMTYGTAGRLANVPLKVTYQPRWWMQVELTLDDHNGTPAATTGVLP